MKGDTDKQADFLAEKVQGLRVFTDAEGKMNLSLEDTGGELLVVSNFTLGTDCKKGRRPSFDLAAPPEEAERFTAILWNGPRPWGSARWRLGSSAPIWRCYAKTTGR